MSTRFRGRAHQLRAPGGEGRAGLRPPDQEFGRRIFRRRHRPEDFCQLARLRWRIPAFVLFGGRGSHCAIGKRFHATRLLVLGGAQTGRPGITRACGQSRGPAYHPTPGRTQGQNRASFRLCSTLKSRLPCLATSSKGVNGDSVYRGASFLAGKLGEKIAAHHITVIDDGTMPGGFGTSPFDGRRHPLRGAP